MDTLYHYCTTETFMRIIEGSSLRLSALSLSNDSMEGKLLNRAMMALAARDRLDYKKSSVLSENLAAIEKIFDGLGCCLSEEGDILSQWRAYANDGKGFSIGFNKAHFKLVEEKVKQVRLRQVSYIDLNDLTTLAPLEKMYQHLLSQLIEVPDKSALLTGLLDSRTEAEREVDGKVHEEAMHKFFIRVYMLYDELFAFKSIAFKEEREWRILYTYPADVDGTLNSEGKFSLDGYRAAPDKLIPFKVLERVKEGAPPWINEVVLGPKNQTPIHIVQNALGKYGFKDVNVRTSIATYR